MTVFAGDPILASDIPDDVGLVTTTATIGTVGTDFTVNDVSGLILPLQGGGAIVQVKLYLARSGSTITATSGNIADTTCFTLASTYRPSEPITAGWDNGSASGSLLVNTSGTVILRTGDGNLGTGTNVRISFMFIRPS